MKKTKFFLPMTAFILAGGIAFAQQYKSTPGMGAGEFDCTVIEEPTCRSQVEGGTIYDASSGQAVLDDPGNPNNPYDLQYED